MLMRTDPFRDLDRLTQQMLGTNGTLARPSVMPMDAWREGDTFYVEFDLPGVDQESIDLDVERNVVTVKAERPPRASDVELVAAERPRGDLQPAADPRRQPRHRAHQRQLQRRRAHPADPGRRAGQAAQDLHQQQGRGAAGDQRLTRGAVMSTTTAGLGARTVDEQLLEMICNDQELLAAEFEAIIAAEWPAPPAHRGEPKATRPAARQRQHLIAPPVVGPVSGRGTRRRSRRPGSAHPRTPLTRK